MPAIIRDGCKPIMFAGPAALLLLFAFAAPLVWVFMTSFEAPAGAGAAYLDIATKTIYRRVLITTAEIAAASTFITLLLSYPVAYHLSRQSRRTRALLSILVLLPFWTSILVKSFAFTVMFGTNGMVNDVLRSMFGEEATIQFMYNRPAVLLGMSHYLMPFMIFAIQSNLLAQNPALRTTAEVMGASRLRIFFSITFPLSLPAIVAGSLMCFILSLGMFVTSALLGSKQDMMISNLINFYVREVLNWPAASALAVILIVVVGALMLLLSRVRGASFLTGGKA